MEQLVTSNFRLGIIAGGQLGKLLALAASNWDVKTFILDKDTDCPAADVCTGVFAGDPANYNDVLQFGKTVDMLTFELENVNIDALKALKNAGKRIIPDVTVLEIIRDKGLQKEFYAECKIPSPHFQVFTSKIELMRSVENGEIKFPFVQKLRVGGYDGKGVLVVKNSSQLNLLLDGPCIVEEMVQIEKEISVIVARNMHGEIKCFDAVEMEFNQHANLVEKLLCPAKLDVAVLNEAYQIATQLISQLNMQGLLAVEMFVDKENKLWVNECAPRPHNSGHHTIESTITSQYEQMLRAIFNFPLGSTRMKMPSVMINILGEPGFEGPVRYEGLTEAMAVEGAKIHLYGKKITMPFRKMGHATVLAQTLEQAIESANKVQKIIKVKS